MKRILLTALLAAALPFTAMADDDDDDDKGFGMAGILSASNKADLEPIQLSSGMPLTSAPWTLKSAPITNSRSRATAARSWH